MANSYSSVSSQTNALLKRFYASAIIDQLNEDMPIYKMAEKVKDSGQGDAMYFPLRLRRNQGIGAGSDGGALPSIGNQTIVQAKLDWKFNWIRFGLTAGLIEASKTSAGAFAKAFDMELKFAYKDFANDFNRQLSWDGTGNLGLLSANAVASNVISVQGREGTNEDGSKFLSDAVGMIIDIVSSAGVVKASGVTITAVTGTSTATVTLDSPVTAASGDLVVRTGNYNKEVQGLFYALDGATSTVYTNIDRSVYTSYQGNVLNLNAGQLTLDKMQQAFNEGLRRGGVGNGKYQAVLMDFDSSRFYQKLLVSDKRYVNAVKLDGGAWDKTQISMEYNGVPLVVDKDMPQRIVFCPTEALAFGTLAEMSVADEWGSNMLPGADNDIYETRIRMFGNLFNKAPAAFGVLRNYVSP